MEAVASQRRHLHCSRPVADNPGHEHPPFKLSACSDFVMQHNQNNAEQQHRTDAPKTLRAARALRAGDVLCSFLGGGARTGEAASHWTLQAGPAVHLDLQAHVFRNVNHSCEPNVRMRGLQCVALRNVAKEEELLLDYNASEYVGAHMRRMSTDGAAARSLAVSHRQAPHPLS
jgi:hypothetical protein